MDKFIAAFLGALTVVLTYFLSKKKAASDLKKTNAEAEAIEATGEVTWHSLVTKLRSDLNELMLKNQELELKVFKLENENKELHRELDNLKQRLNDNSK